ncbi:MAG: NADPH-dependent F420 reductase [Dehalococcoidia bacterium]|nr:NADPH-dependent F420 reductase [Dehalococcoidia bacterium]
MPTHHTIAFLGGTGPEGLGLAIRFAKAGDAVIIGSRSAERAEEAAQKIRAAVPTANARGAVNAEAVAHADIVMITVPYAGQKESLEAVRAQIGTKIVVDTVVPLHVEKGKFGAHIVPEGSAAQQAQAVLPQARVVAAFHNLSAHTLMQPDLPVDADVVVCADDAEAKRVVIALAGKIAGVRGIDGGGLHSARFIEDMTALILTINRIYKTHAAIKIVGV